jgi:predicted nucleic acid-binding protein
MSARAFFDTNIFVYAIVQEYPRADHALALVTGGGTVSVQVLNEFAAVARMKTKMSWTDIGVALESITILCPNPLPITLETHTRAMAIAEKHGFNIYDALIVASALEGKCTTLYSEDMQDGQVVEGKLTIRNPFR